MAEAATEAAELLLASATDVDALLYAIITAKTTTKTESTKHFILGFVCVEPSAFNEGINITIPN